ncbi:sodium:solute symporter family transporter [Isachenkonia alkalipeptolytica]|uniref:Sodium:solute symporter family protein n=1 Tax=Isachenkonia alkalipeptolytica TaxID=2565777 RepID=A0AA44BEX8_9CLOT|nr:hypothetical protein [Isachenkonia alkalipeptolytica]NBG88620.1 hypothetical protein [Isachenkonia alkalipeptolytica]
MISSSLIYAIIILTVMAFTAIGVIYSRGKFESLDDFVTARGTAGTKILSTTFLASFLGVFILFTPPEAGSIGGITTIIGYALGLASLYIAFMILSPKIRNYLPKGSTLNDFARKRYGKKMYLLVLLLSIFYMFVHLVAELTAISLVAYELAGIPLIFTALFVGVGTMIYIAYGGLRASMFTDMIQMVFVLVLLLVTTVGVVYYLGGIGNMITLSTENAPELFDFRNLGGIEFGLTLGIAVFVANLFHQGYWQRVYSGKNDRSIRKSLIFSIIIAVPVMLLTGFFGILSTGLGFGENPSVALFSLVYGIFPRGLIILVFILALVLVMSTVDTLLNGMVATFSANSRGILKDMETRSLLRFARALTLVIILPATLIAAQGYSVLYLFLVADLLCAGVVFPLFYGLFNKYVTENTALLASLLGIASGIPFFMADRLLVSFTLPIVISGAVTLMGTAYGKKQLAKNS